MPENGSKILAMLERLVDIGYAHSTQTPKPRRISDRLFTSDMYSHKFDDWYEESKAKSDRSMIVVTALGLPRLTCEAQ